MATNRNSFPMYLGFDKLLEDMERKLQVNEKFPPYNVIRVNAHEFVIEIACAGYRKEDINVSIKDNILNVVGYKEKKLDSKSEFLHRGIAERDFSRQFTLSDRVVVKGAEYNNGILSINLEEIVPESSKPKLIDIK